VRFFGVKATARSNAHERTHNLFRNDKDAVGENECLPFSQIPHTSPFLRLPFLTLPLFANSIPFASVPRVVKEEAQRVRYDDVRRQTVRTHSKIRISTLAQDQKLSPISKTQTRAQTQSRANKSVMFGGPTILNFKALTAVNSAEQATAAGVVCPDFLARNRRSRPSRGQSCCTSFRGRSSRRLAIESTELRMRPSARFSLARRSIQLSNARSRSLGDTDVARWLASPYRQAETMAVPLPDSWRACFKIGE